MPAPSRSARTSPRGDADRRAAVDRAASYLLSCLDSRGAITDSVPDPLRCLDPEARLTRAERFRITGGADVWHTVSAIWALGCLGRRERRAEQFVLAQRFAEGGLPYGTGRPGLCLETTAAAALASRRLRGSATRVLLHHALPHGRWATFMLNHPGGYETYLAGPSVTALAMLVLGRDRRGFAGALGYLKRCLEPNGTWAAHPGFYATPFYPAHLGTRLLRPRSVLDHALRTQHAVGGWGFGDPPGRPHPLPTALALLTLANFPHGPRVRRAWVRGADWLVRAQSTSGGWALHPAPRALWYTGPVFVTATSLRALCSLGAGHDG
jgi:hypothetical protein